MAEKVTPNARTFAPAPGTPEAVLVTATRNPRKKREDLLLMALDLGLTLPQSLLEEPRATVVDAIMQALSVRAELRKVEAAAENIEAPADEEVPEAPPAAEAQAPPPPPVAKPAPLVPQVPRHKQLVKVIPTLTGMFHAGGKMRRLEKAKETTMERDAADFFRERGMVR